MLRPQLNNHRWTLNQSGIWKFKFDKQNIGEKEKWYNDFESDLELAVPGNWNEQVQEDEMIDYIGAAWYSKELLIPGYIDHQKIWFWIGASDFLTKVWINGKEAGEHFGGFLPVNLDITPFVEIGKLNKIVIMVNNELSDETIPQGVSMQYYIDEKRMREESYPAARFDFFPYGGISRPVYVYSTPKAYLKDIKVVTALISDDKGRCEIEVETGSVKSGKILFNLEGHGYSARINADIKEDKCKAVFEIKNCRFWSIDEPALYDLKVNLIENGVITDEYDLKIGIREIMVDGYKLLLNNKPVFLKGFGKHEDFPIIGKSMCNQVMIKDFSLLKWINANSFRTSHYPYAEEFLDMADKKGFLIIDEVPAVSLDFRHVNEKTLQNHKNSIKELIQRDKNHPCVISWSLGNEPNLAGECEYHDGRGKKYWEEIFKYAKSLDNTRPYTVPNCPRAGSNDPVLELSDYLSLNRYYGWYENPGQIELGTKRMEEEMDLMAEKYKKPILVTEFGTDTMAGLHSISDQMFTEEYQAKYIEYYCRLIESKPYTIGEHVWNFADFRTPQIFRRVVNNLKGVFTRTREPKLAAFRLKEIWSK